MCKQNKPTFNLGSGSGPFPYPDIAAATYHSCSDLNMHDPPLAYVHELPAEGWLALRFKIEEPAATMFHVFRARYFVLGMQVVLLEGDDHWPEVPEEMRNRPHVEFMGPEDEGIFG
jgi:L-ascorbate oxidase